MAEDIDLMRMTKIVDGKEYATAKSAEIHHYTVQHKTCKKHEIVEVLYRSRHGQLFTVCVVWIDAWTQYDIDCWNLFEDGSDDLRQWLEGAEASRSVYEATGFKIEEG